jgi:hypothetical protein
VVSRVKTETDPEHTAGRCRSLYVVIGVAETVYYSGTAHELR